MLCDGRDEDWWLVVGGGAWMHDGSDRWYDGTYDTTMVRYHTYLHHRVGVLIGCGFGHKASVVSSDLL